jgi:hypothetical protein
MVNVRWTLIDGQSILNWIWIIISQFMCNLYNVFETLGHNTIQVNNTLNFKTTFKIPYLWKYQIIFYVKKFNMSKFFLILKLTLFFNTNF